LTFSTSIICYIILNSEEKNDKKLKSDQEGADDHFTAAHRGIAAEKRYFLFFHPAPSACGAVF